MQQVTYVCSNFKRRLSRVTSLQGIVANSSSIGVNSILRNQAKV